MCGFEKCCFLLPIDLGCILLGFVTFIISLASAIFSIVMLCIEESNPDQGFEYFHTFSHLNLNASAIKIVLSITCISALMLIVFSVMLIIGIIKNKPNFVLCYFGFGIMMVILWSLTGLLVLLKNHWIMAMTTFIFVCLYTHCLSVVYSAYEQMVSGKLSRFISNHDSEDLTALVDSDLPESDVL